MISPILAAMIRLVASREALVDAGACSAPCTEQGPLPTILADAKCEVSMTVDETTEVQCGNLFAWYAGQGGVETFGPNKQNRSKFYKVDHKGRIRYVGQSIVNYR